MTTIQYLVAHPKIAWNVWIMLQYVGAMLWWAYHREPIHVAYWFFALGITATVTIGLVQK